MEPSARARQKGPPLPPSPSHRPQETRGEGRCDGEGGRGYRKPFFMRLEILIIKQDENMRFSWMSHRKLARRTLTPKALLGRAWRVRKKMRQEALTQKTLSGMTKGESGAACGGSSTGGEERAVASCSPGGGSVVSEEGKRKNAIALTKEESGPACGGFSTGPPAADLRRGVGMN